MRRPVALAALLLLSLAACTDDADPAGSRPPSAPPSVAPSLPASTSVPPSVAPTGPSTGSPGDGGDGPACTSAGLEVTAGQLTAQRGAFTYPLEVRTRGGTCAVAGPLRLEVVDARGGVVASAQATGPAALEGGRVYATELGAPNPGRCRRMTGTIRVTLGAATAAETTGVRVGVCGRITAAPLR
ncbi:hypothetical protein [Spirilliplanes yamanashiensis]|uniref:DUF4232 domain-containing protein n=1 Tax=Spirilliplanes yamanashiensis TaxID=42233 RepID=A0A8J3Y5L0_9ACTN|nr:hypothetical protein [Spirilliplanes yamanashiensis]MDP9819267.1 hypothetical protein [Spirilliplanes yamanashiensis]GIJ01909.1 hypothetical protein Sya03_12610 [Spirilliplanes yamanashiensis]